MHFTTSMLTVHSTRAASTDEVAPCKPVLCLSLCRKGDFTSKVRVNQDPSWVKEESLNFAFLAHPSLTLPWIQVQQGCFSLEMFVLIFDASQNKNLSTQLTANRVYGSPKYSFSLKRSLQHHCLVFQFLQEPLCKPTVNWSARGFPHQWARCAPKANTLQKLSEQRSAAEKIQWDNFF